MKKIRTTETRKRWGSETKQNKETKTKTQSKTTTGTQNNIFMLARITQSHCCTYSSFSVSVFAFSIDKENRKPKRKMTTEQNKNKLDNRWKQNN